MLRWWWPWITYGTVCFFSLHLSSWYPISKKCFDDGSLECIVTLCVCFYFLALIFLACNSLPSSLAICLMSATSVASLPSLQEFSKIMRWCNWQESASLILNVMVIILTKGYTIKSSLAVTKKPFQHYVYSVNWESACERLVGYGKKSCMRLSY